jgi:hypothetical protein
MISGQRIPREAQILHDTTTDQVFLDDALRVLRRNLPIPRALRVNDRNRPSRADAQALTLCSIEGPVGSRDVELLHPALQIEPGLLPLFEIAAIGAETNEQVARQLADAKRRRGFGRSLVLPLTHPLIITTGIVFADERPLSKGVVMANRQDSGSNSAHQNQRPTSHNEDALPEMTESRDMGEDARNLGEDEDDEFDESEDAEDLEDEDEEDEGSI